MHKNENYIFSKDSITFDKLAEDDFLEKNYICISINQSLERDILDEERLFLPKF